VSYFSLTGPAVPPFRPTAEPPAGAPGPQPPVTDPEPLPRPGSAPAAADREASASGARAAKALPADPVAEPRRLRQPPGGRRLARTDAAAPPLTARQRLLLLDACRHRYDRRAAFR
jgi:hypothetical protein